MAKTFNEEKTDKLHGSINAAIATGNTQQITGQTFVWLGSHGNPAHLKDPETAIAAVNFAAHDMMGAGWTFLGLADVTLTIVNDEQIVHNKVGALKEELKQHRAQAQVRENQLQDQINQLLAIAHKPESETIDYE